MVWGVSNESVGSQKIPHQKSFPSEEKWISEYFESNDDWFSPEKVRVSHCNPLRILYRKIPIKINRIVPPVSVKDRFLLFIERKNK